MKKFAFIFLILFLFSGCLLQPQISVKSAEFSDNGIAVNIYSNKSTSALMKVSGLTDSCEKSFILNQGNNEVLVECSLTDSKILIEVLSEGAGFSKEFSVSFNSSVNQKIFSLIETTNEGKLLKLFEKGFNDSDSCNAEKFIEIYRNAQDFFKPNSSYQMNYDFDLNDSELNELQQQINKTKNCLVSFPKEISDKGNGVFEVSYSIIPSGDCSYAGTNSSAAITTQKDTVVFEVNLNDNSVEAIKGGFGELQNQEEKEMMELQIKSFELFDGCLKASVLGVSFIPVIDPLKEGLCITSAGSEIEITLFKPTETYIIVQIKNNSSDEIELIGFTGKNDFSCNGCPQKIPAGETRAFNLMGSFTGAIEEQLTIKYKLNGINFSVLSECTGTVEMQRATETEN